MANLQRRAWLIYCVLLVSFLPLAGEGRTEERIVIEVHSSQHDGDPSVNDSSISEIEQALVEVVERRRLDADAEIIVTLWPGVYRLKRTLSLDGRTLTPGKGGLTIKAAGEGRVEIVGSVELGTPLTTPPQDLVALIPDALRPSIIFFDVGRLRNFGVDHERGHSVPAVPAPIEFFQGHIALRSARWPATGYLPILRAASEDATVTERSSFAVVLPPLPIVANPALLWATGFPSATWRSERVHVLSYDAASGTVWLNRDEQRYPMLEKGRLAFEGAVEFMARPGDSFFDYLSGILAVWPIADLGESPFEASMINDSIIATDIHDLRLEGLSIGKVRNDGLQIRNGSNVSIVDCLVSNVGNRGIVVEGGNNVLLGRNVVANTGQESVWVTGGNRISLERSQHRVFDNILIGSGRLNPAPRGALWLDGVGTLIEGNLFELHPGTGIRYLGNDHRIARNEFSATISACGDCGVIYTGYDWASRGTIIEENFIHSSPSYPGVEGKGIYLDDLASGQTVRRNLVMSASKGVLVGGGRDNHLTDNLIAGANIYGITIDSRGTSWMAPMIDDPKSEIYKRLKAVPFDRPPYADRYTNLANILSDEPSLPKYNALKNNIFIRGRGLIVDPSVNQQSVEISLSGREAGQQDLFGGDEELEARDVLAAIRILQLPIEEMKRAPRLYHIRFFADYLETRRYMQEMR
jgi:hypothetical protein